MKKIIKIALITLVIAALLSGCSDQLTTKGCRIIRDEDGYVTYQTVCDNCGYEYGDPSTAYVDSYELYYTVTCTACREIIYVRIERR